MNNVDYQAPALAWYDAMPERDWPRLEALIAEDIDFRVAAGFPAGGRYIGRRAVFDDYFPRASRAWRTLVPVIDQAIPAGEHTVVLGRYVGVTAVTATPFDIEFAHIWKTDGYQITELRQYVDTAVFRDILSGGSRP